MECSHLTEVEAREKIGRYLTNALGVGEIVTMDRLSWDYLDWLLKTVGGDVGTWVAHCDRLRGSEPLSDAFQSWLYLEFQCREIEGSPRPGWLAPFTGDIDAPA